MLTLAQHLVQITFIDLQAVSSQHVGTQCRAFLFAYWGQLRLVANEQQAAIAITIVNVLHQIIEQTTAAKH